MTGVSLAGTQLRVNQYTMQDPEWNDITVSIELNLASVEKLTSQFKKRTFELKTTVKIWRTNLKI